MKYYRAHRRDFDWKYEAENFARKIRGGAKKLRCRVDIRILPIRAFSSSTAQRWNWRNRIIGEKKAETKTTGYVVRWEYRPIKRTSGR